MEQTSLPSSGRFISLRETLGKNGCRTAEHPCGRAGVGAVEVLGSCAVLVGPVRVATGPNPQLELDHAFTREGTVVSRGCPADHGVYLAQSGYSGPMCSRIMATYWRSVTTSRSSLPASGAPILDDIVGNRRGGAVGEVVPLRGGRGVVGSVYPIPPVFRREILGEAFVVVCVDISGGSVTTMIFHTRVGSRQCIGCRLAGPQAATRGGGCGRLRSPVLATCCRAQVLCPFTAGKVDESGLPSRR